jgi:RNA polymerase subunit RPABC4/transcription elongation factor Spt4
MIPPGASMSSWPCPRCTLINPDSSNICEGCEFERILAWACPACTFINDINPTDCDMCGTTNPDRKAVSTGANTTRELIVDSDSDDVIIENWRCSRCGTLTSASTSLCENCTQRIDISVNNERRPTTIVSNSARSAFAGAALGAVVGAGASFLQSGSLVEGALRGATWGAVGGLMANSGDTIVDSARSDSFRRPNRRRGASSALSAVQPSQQRQRRGDSDGSSGSPSWAASEIGFPMTTVSGVEFDRPMGRRGRGAARRAGTRPGGGDEDELDAMLHRHIASLLFSSFIIGNTNPGIDIDNMSYDELYER